MKNQIVGFTIGILLLIIGITGLIPAFVDWLNGHPNYFAFLKCSVVSMIFGGGLVIMNKPTKPTLSIRQGFLLTACSWFFLSLFASFPLYFSDLDITLTDAFFESVSGVTTTGSTVLAGLDNMSHGILLWRSIIQWIGGIGIIAFAIIILPFLNIGGMQLFKTESSDRSDKFIPKTKDLVRSLLFVYCLLTLACLLTYYILGMSFFDAINHAFTTIPTGGYSTHDASFGHFQSPALHYAGSFFMLCGGLPFVLFVKILIQGKFELHKDEQVRTIIGLLAIMIVTLSIWLWLNSDYSYSETLMLSTFNIISVITTTGYATTDYIQWGPFAVMFFFMITFLGGCAGSTSGGIKTMRLIIAYRMMRRQMKILLFPHGVFSVHYQGKSVDQSVVTTVMVFLGAYFMANIALTIILTFLGLDFETAISGAATAIANVGPGIGGTIGPAGNFSTLPESAKLVLCFGMLLGRLEIMTILVLFRREFWEA
jgi:trk system potassium uptake protein